MEIYYTVKKRKIEEAIQRNKISGNESDFVEIALLQPHFSTWILICGLFSPQHPDNLNSIRVKKEKL